MSVPTIGNGSEDYEDVGFYKGVIWGDPRRLCVAVKWML